MLCPGPSHGCSNKAMNCVSSDMAAVPGIAGAVRREALRLGFVACGFAVAAPVDETCAASLRSWLDEGMNDTMGYMSSNIDKRLDPALLVPGARTVIVVALPYRPAVMQPPATLRISCYAYGRDYHDVMRARLAQLAASLPVLAGKPVQGRCFCDTAPLMERYWAWRAGLGWVGKSCNLIIPGVGSMTFLGAIVCDLVIPPGTPLDDRCGSCTACLAACPSGALVAPRRLDARRCLSCQTIEHRGPLAPATIGCLGDRIYGCDTCQMVCPHNHGVPAGGVPEFAPSGELLSMTVADWAALTEERYRRLFRGSAVKRAKYEGLMRNIRAALSARGGRGNQ